MEIWKDKYQPGILVNIQKGCSCLQADPWGAPSSSPGWSVKDSIQLPGPMDAYHWIVSRGGPTLLSPPRIYTLRSG